MAPRFVRAGSPVLRKRGMESKDLSKKGSAHAELIERLRDNRHL